MAELAIEQPSPARRKEFKEVEEFKEFELTSTSPTRPKSKSYAAGAAAEKVVHVDYEREEDVADR